MLSRFCCFAIVLLCAGSTTAQIVIPRAEIQRTPGMSADHVSKKRNKGMEDIARNMFDRVGFPPKKKILDISSANLSDCLLWSGDNKDSLETKKRFPDYFRPTDLKGWAVVVDVDFDGDGKLDNGMVYLLNDDGEYERMVDASSIKFSGGQAARKAGRPTTNGLRPDADPLKDALKSGK